jgi:hypothetical protein
LSQSCVTVSVASNFGVSSCECLAHRFGNAGDRQGRTPCYAWDMTEAEWQEVRPALPVPAWLQGRGGRPEGYCHRVMLDQCHEVKAQLTVSRPREEGSCTYSVPYG